VSTFLAVVKELKLPSFEATDLKEVWSAFLAVYQVLRRFIITIACK
jgi:hypothetical protein